MKKTFIINGEEIAVEDMVIRHGELSFTLDGAEYRFAVQADGGGHFTLRHDGRNRSGFVARNGTVFLQGGLEAMVEQQGLERKRGEAGSKGAPHTAPMPGTVQKVLVKPGDSVEPGQALVVMEAMKLQLTIEAAYAGTVEEVCCEAGGLVSEGVLLVRVASV